LSLYASPCLISYLGGIYCVTKKRFKFPLFPQWQSPYFEIPPYSKISNITVIILVTNNCCIKSSIKLLAASSSIILNL
jgi:hypothetical protein